MGSGRLLDNICVKRLWQTVKQDEVYLKEYRTPLEARVALGAWIGHYNKRPHQRLDNRTPCLSTIVKERWDKSMRKNLRTNHLIFVTPWSKEWEVPQIINNFCRQVLLIHPRGFGYAAYLYLYFRRWQTYVLTLKSIPTKSVSQ
jgi:hypothetical protein